MGALEEQHFNFFALASKSTRNLMSKSMLERQRSFKTPLLSKCEVFTMGIEAFLLVIPEEAKGGLGLAL